MHLYPCKQVKRYHAIHYVTLLVLMLIHFVARREMGSQPQLDQTFHMGMNKRYIREGIRITKYALRNH